MYNGSVAIASLQQDTAIGAEMRAIKNRGRHTCLIDQSNPALANGPAAFVGMPVANETTTINKPYERSINATFLAAKRPTSPTQLIRSEKDIEIV
jgi:hypothetical protein